ncbi:MAG: restriction endonuclease subunit S [Burkholderiaceae bacterium]|nr:restriction endonuclease subunit S [Burkholderiaceae bacterium]
MSFDLPSLPGGWSYAPLETCSEKKSITYGVVQPGAALDAGKPLIRVNNFKDGRLDLSDVMYISPDIESKYSRTRLVGGEVLLTLVGSVGQVATVPSDLEGFNVARAVAVIHPLPHIEPRWIAICLRSPLSQHLLGSRANTTVQTTINLKDLRALPIPLPPVDERQTIVEFISALDDRITLLRETNATLEAIAQALFKSWFVDFDPVRAKMEGRAPEGMGKATAALFPVGFETSELGEVPRGWRVSCIDEIADRIGMGPFGSNIKVETFVDDGVPVLNGSNVQGAIVEDGAFRFITKEHASRLRNSCVQAGDIVLTHRGTLGQVALVPSKSRYGEYVCSQSQFFLRCDLRVMQPEWMLHFLRSPVGQHQLLSNASQVGVPSIARPTTNLRSMRLLVPPPELVRQYSTVVEPLHTSVVSKREHIAALSALRDTLLPRLISGQLRLPEAQAATEAALGDAL